MSLRSSLVSATVARLVLLTIVKPAHAQSVLPYPEPEFKGAIGRTTADSKGRLSPARQSAQGSPERSADHDGRRGLWRLEYVRRPHPHAGL